MRGALAALLVLLPAAAAQPLLVAVVPDLPGPATGADAVAIGSPTGLNATGLVVTDGEDEWMLPDVALRPREPLWLVGDLAAWDAHQGPRPAMAMPWPLRLGDDGDDVHLLAADGAVLDAMAYGARDPDGVLPGTSPGLVLRRDRSAAGWVDTDASADWSTPRVHKLGESDLAPVTFEADAVTLYASPDASFAVLTDLLATAARRLHLHVYELRSPELADALVAARLRQPGLDVQVLVDANPVGAGDADRHATADALRRVQAAGGHVVLAGNGRYDDHHLKVLVADDAVAVQSENWVPSGVPVDPSWGNRGWGAVLHDAEAADWFAGWMADDRAAWDVAPFVLDDFDPTFAAPPRRAPRTGDHDAPVPPLRVEGPVLVTPLVAPDHTQDPRADPVAALLHGAEATILAQQLDLAATASNRLGWHSDDPWLIALGAAARRGVDVRVQAAAPFSSDDAGNGPELAWLAAAGARTALLDRPGLGTLHNKAFVVDGDVVVLGSMNGNHHSRSANREVSLVLRSQEAAAWATAVFEDDWDPPSPGRDWGVPGQDLRALPPAPWPTLFALLGVAHALRNRR